MNLENKKIGFILTGSFCTFNQVISKMKELIRIGANIIPIMSFNSYDINTKYGDSKTYINNIENICNTKIIHTIEGAEHICHKEIPDILLIAPCTGNTISKLAYDISDTPATMAVKSHLRNNLPVVVGIVSSDGLSYNAENIGKLLSKKLYYFIPFMQDNPITKPNSLVFDSDLLIKTLEFALDGEQIQPLLR